jgi:RHS repeat-associated protein
LSGSIQYAHDTVGNRLSRTHSGSGSELQLKVPAQSGLSYDANDRLAADDANTYGYDFNGNTTGSGAGGAVVDQYDFENRLISRNNGQIQIVYDGDGTRVKKVVGNITIWFVVDDRNPSGYMQVLEEWESVDGAAPVLKRVYTHGHDLISQRQPALPPAQGVHFYGYDGHGSVRFFVSQDGSTMTDNYSYDGYGILIASTGTTPNNYRDAGEYLDFDLGLYHHRARDRNQNTGRFWTRDTFEGFQTDPLSLHVYLYAHLDPVNRLDPSGHMDFIQMLATTKIGATIIAMGGAATAIASRNASTILRGTARAVEVAQRVIASGGDIVAWEERVVRATQAGIQVLGRFKLDMIVKLPSPILNTLIESKSIPWDLYTRHPGAWQNFLNNAQRQANTFSQATQSQGGVPIGERVIYFTTRVPQGLEKAAQEVEAVVSKHYDKVLWGADDLEMFLGK